MASSCNLIFAIHCHQPVGNFETAIEEAYQRAYRPFLDVLERHNGVRVVMHLSGCLLEHLLTRHPDYIERLHAAGQRGQIEFMGGAYYEPILCVIPDHDKIGQILKMNEMVERYLGRRPTGMWLAERVWEPHLPASIAQAGMRYTVLDEVHFRHAGLAADDCLGYWRTEELGSTLAVFPIVERLSDLIPDGEPDVALDLLCAQAAASERPEPLLATVVCNGEQLGLWADSHRRCYEQGWLDRFFTALETRAAQCPTIHFREALERLAPRGAVYLPAASYRQMMEWSLPLAAGESYRKGRELLERAGLAAALAPFLCGGFWRNFLARYPAVSRIHKKMLHISRRIQSALDLLPRDQALHSAREFLWRGQCGDAYWHGVYGGLYMTHLRHAVYRNLIIAERLIGESVHGEEPWLTVERLDYNLDGHEELLIETERWQLVCAPHLGGELVEADYKPCDLNLADTIMRVPEPYHEPLRAAAAARRKDDGADAAPPIVYDRYRRLCAIDHFFPVDTTFEDFRLGQYVEAGDCVEQPYQDRPTLSGKTLGIPMRRMATVQTPRGPMPVSVTKLLRVAAGDDHLTWTYVLRNTASEPIHILWGVEWNINLLAGEAPDRYAFVQGQPVRHRRLGADEVHEGVVCFGLVNTPHELRITMTLSEPARLWRTAIETLLPAPLGIDRMYQGTTLLPNWRLTLAPGGQRQIEIMLACSHGDAPAKLPAS